MHVVQMKPGDGLLFEMLCSGFFSTQSRYTDKPRKYRLVYVNPKINTLKLVLIHQNPQTGKWAWSTGNYCSRPFTHWSFAEQAADWYLQPLWKRMNGSMRESR